jgi:hypothetical protein
MGIQAKYYANMKDGRSIHLCKLHVKKVAIVEDGGRMYLRRGVRSIGSLSKFTPKTCVECSKEVRAHA